MVKEIAQTDPKMIFSSVGHSIFIHLRRALAGADAAGWGSLFWLVHFLPSLSDGDISHLHSGSKRKAHQEAVEDKVDLHFFKERQKSCLAVVTVWRGVTVSQNLTKIEKNTFF